MSHNYEKFSELPLLPESKKYFFNKDGYNIIDINYLIEKNLNQEESISLDRPCNNCKNKSYHIKKISIASLPSVLIITIQRYNPRNNTKNNFKLIYNDFLDLEKFIDRELCKKF
jgi:ubiquitin C-terminal hydrolase